MERKLFTPRCDVAMANNFKNKMPTFRCDHIGEVKNHDCWHCLCFIVRHGIDDEHLRFTGDYQKWLRTARLDTEKLIRGLQ